MMNFYKYIYYQVYTWQLERWGAKHVPGFKATAIVWIVVLQNLFTVGLVLQALGVVTVAGLSKATLLPIFGVVFAALYYIFMYDDKYLSIVRKFAAESPRQKILNTIFMWVFIISSFAVNFIIIDLFLR
jgi:hypothetical protein